MSDVDCGYGCSIYHEWFMKFEKDLLDLKDNTHNNNMDDHPHSINIAID